MPTQDAPQLQLPAGTELHGSLPSGHERVLTPGALDLVADLVRRFRPRVEQLLERRRDVQRRFDAGERPDFLSATEELRASDWTVAPIPDDLRDRRVELTGPTDRETIVDALDSGANVFLADLEDSSSPTWRNVVEGQVNLKDAVDGTIAHAAPETGRASRPRGRAPVLMVRPRGWHLGEKHVLVDGKRATAALWDFGIYLWNNARALLAKGTGPYFYLPKLEGHLEARLWNDVFVHAQERLGIPRGSIRATVLVETLPAAFEMDELLWELRDHCAGLGCGRWSYPFSTIKRFRADRRHVFPDRALVTMDEGFLRACVQLLVRTCHRRGVHAMGGGVAQLPLADDRASNELALAKVRADTLREVTDGHDGTRVAHPALVPVAKAIFDEHMPTPNQIHRKREDVVVAARDLLRVPVGPRTEAGLRHNVRVSVQYLEAWLRGSGRVPLYGLMEDAASVELSRSITWHWIHHGVTLDDGKPLTVERFRAVLAEELDRIRLEVGERRFEEGRFEDARALFAQLGTQPELVEFMTLPAYELLEAGEAERARILSGAPEAAGASPAPEHPDPRRWAGIVRGYGAAEVERLRGSVRIEHTLAQLGARRLWELLHTEPFVASLGALTGTQAVQMVRAGLKAIHASGWQAAAGANAAGQADPDPSLHPSSSAPALVKRLNAALQRADQIEHAEGRNGTRWFAPVVADAEAGFGGPLDAFELMRALIEAGAAGVQLEDSLAAERTCGHLGGKVLVPTSTFVRTLAAARLAADVMGVPTVLVARTDAERATLVLSDVDPQDAPFVDRSRRTPEGFYGFRGGLEAAIARGLAYAPHADVIGCETQAPDLGRARRFAEAIHAKHPGKLLAYDCSPSFDWRKHLDDAAMARFQRELGAMGYRFQLVGLAGFHALSHSMFELARGYRDRGMAAYSELQQAELAAERHGYAATRHQREVGLGYLDAVAAAIAGGAASALAREASPEAPPLTAGGSTGATHAAEQVRAALAEDHGRIEALVARLRSTDDVTALGAALDELRTTLTEHFAHEEHAKGFYGVVGARSPRCREELDAMIREHRELLAALQDLADRAKGHEAAPDLPLRSGELAARLLDHEAREVGLARELV